MVNFLGEEIQQYMSFAVFCSHSSSLQTLNLTSLGKLEPTGTGLLFLQYLQYIQNSTGQTAKDHNATVHIRI